MAKIGIPENIRSEMIHRIIDIALNEHAGIWSEGESHSLMRILSRIKLDESPLFWMAPKKKSTIVKLIRQTDAGLYESILPYITCEPNPQDIS